MRRWGLHVYTIYVAYFESTANMDCVGQFSPGMVTRVLDLSMLSNKAIVNHCVLLFSYSGFALAATTQSMGNSPLFSPICEVPLLLSWKFQGDCPIALGRQNLSLNQSQPLEGRDGGGSSCICAQPNSLRPANQPAHDRPGSRPEEPARSPFASTLHRLTSTTFVLHIHTAWFSPWPLQSSYVAAYRFFQKSLVSSIRDSVYWRDCSASHWLFSPPPSSIPPPAYPFAFGALGISLQPTIVALDQPVQSQVQRRYQS